jgi:hypothetical protein
VIVIANIDAHGPELPSGLHSCSLVFGPTTVPYDRIREAPSSLVRPRINHSLECQPNHSGSRSMGTQTPSVSSEPGSSNRSVNAPLTSSPLMYAPMDSIQSNCSGVSQAPTLAKVSLLGSCGLQGVAIAGDDTCMKVAATNAISPKQNLALRKSVIPKWLD